jgi:hypothetical protein
VAGSKLARVIESTVDRRAGALYLLEASLLLMNIQ